VSAAAELRRVADEFREIAADIGDGEPATDRDQRQQTAAMRAYREAAHRIEQRAKQLEA
jgi:hypothetical protein